MGASVECWATLLRKSARKTTNGEIRPAMLPNKPSGVDADEPQMERRMRAIRLFVIRNGRLVELARRERHATVHAEPPAVSSKPAGVKQD
jgi:hypothetical protein